MAVFMRSHRSRLGATLAEGIVAMFVSGLFLSLLPGLYLTGTRVWQRETSKLAASGSADFALQRMKDDIRIARRAVVSSDGSSLSLVLPMRSYDAALGCEANVIDEQGMLQDGNCVQYYLLADSESASSGRTLYRRVVAPGGDVLRSTTLV
jgi:Tfp pilus assembly protein PilW